MGIFVSFDTEEAQKELVGVVDQMNSVHRNYSGVAGDAVIKHTGEQNGKAGIVLKNATISDAADAVDYVRILLVRFFKEKNMHFEPIAA